VTAPPGPLRWPLFRLLEKLSDLRGNVALQGTHIEQPASPQPALWVYVSTIGELNAVQPLLVPVVAALPHLRLVLITEHAHYADAYRARWPQASVAVTRGHSRDAAALARAFPPRLLLLAEIPCLPHDAPCRFSHAFVRAARAAGARMVLANGWAYGYTPASRMDSLEASWFGRDQVRSFDLLCVQSDAGKEKLVRAGANAERVVVTGNLKFDALAVPPDPTRARSAVLLGSVRDSGRPTVVSGCLTRDDELVQVLEAFRIVRSSQAKALLVLAPRHPEVPRNMEFLSQALAKHAMPWVKRSTHGDLPLAESVAALVLDTMGDLRDFYAAAHVAHVGVDHNVLEPLAYGKPVTVGPGWNPTYPSYPVYQLLSGRGGLMEVTAHSGESQALAGHWLSCLLGGQEGAAQAARAQAALSSASGATARHLLAMRPHLLAAGADPP
jgi:3-deoxy-D-manno-octulosonic-acid transferase